MYFCCCLSPVSEVHRQAWVRYQIRFPPPTANLVHNANLPVGVGSFVSFWAKTVEA